MSKEDLIELQGVVTEVLAGATNRTYELTSATASDEGYYDVVVEDALGGRQFGHVQPARRHCAGLVENHGGDLGTGFQCRAVADENAAPRRS